MAKRIKPKVMYKGKVIFPFTVNDIHYKVGDIYENEHESSIKYLITIKKLK